MFKTGKEVNELFLKCNIQLDKINEWFLANKISLNANNTYYTLFDPQVRRKNTDINANLKIDYIVIIQEVSTCKYLGVHIDNHLTWADHISNVYKNKIKYTGLFYKVRDKIPNNCLKKLYYALVHPHVLYGIELYANMTKSFLNKLIILSSKILRILQRKSISTNVYMLHHNYSTLPVEILQYNSCI